MRLEENIYSFETKKSNPKGINNYQPINLCNTMYKVVAKILVNRLKHFLSSLVSIEQGAFVPSQTII